MNPTATRTRPGASSAASTAPCSKVELRNIAYRQGQLPAGQVLRAAHRGWATSSPTTRRPAAATAIRWSATRKVLDDVLDGFITVDHARDDYGVVLSEVDDGYGWALDSEATRALRAEMARG